jgi:hypothetical protein
VFPHVCSNMSEDEGAFDSAEKFIEISGTNISVLEADWLDECRCLHGYELS